MVKKGIKFSKEDLFISIIIYTLVTMALFIVMYPLYFVLIASFSDPFAVYSGSVLFYPVKFTLKGYQKIFEHAKIMLGYRNTILYTVFGTCFNLFLTIPAGYALSRKDFTGKKIIMGYFVVTMFFGGGLIPTFLVVRDLGLYNTPWVMIIMGGISIWNTIICRTFFSIRIPSELLDAASVDGCTNMRFFFKIVLPLSKAIIGVMALYYSVGHWNEYMNALIYLKDSELYTLQLILRDILIRNTILAEDLLDIGTGQPPERLEDLIRFSSIIIASLPMLIFYPFVQKYFDKGVLVGSLKG